MKYFTMDDLQAGIEERRRRAVDARLVERWSRTGLLRGLNDEQRGAMARKLEREVGGDTRQMLIATLEGRWYPLRVLFLRLLATPSIALSPRAL